jgi:hypothetical protein
MRHPPEKRPITFYAPTRNEDLDPDQEEGSHGFQVRNCGSRLLHPEGRGEA